MDSTVFYVGFLALFLFVIYKKWHLRKAGKPIQGPSGLPFIGSAIGLTMENVYQRFSDFATKYGDIVQIKIFNTTVVSLNSEELVRKAFGENPYKTVMNNKGYFFVADYILCGAQSIGFYEKGHDPVHNEMRKGMTKGFHVYGDGVEEFEEKVQTELKRLLKTIEDFGGQEFEFEAVIKRSLANLISVLLNGEQMRDGEEEMFFEFNTGADALTNPFVNSLLSVFPFLRHFPGPLRSRYQGILKSQTWIKARYVDRQKDSYVPGKVRGYVDCLFKQQLDDIDKGRAVTFTYERIVCSALETVVGGILTSLSVLTNTMLCLLNHPEYQRKIQQELDSVIGRDRLPKISDRGMCPLTEAVVMEVMRYITPLPFLLPHVCSEDVEFEGYHIAKDSLIIANVNHIHMDEKVWGDPFTFRPERFLDDDGQLLPRGHIFMKSWLPFSTGRRSCVGEGFGRSRIFLYLATLVQRWDYVPIPGKYGSCDVRKTDQFQISTTVRPKPFFCRVENRN